MTRTLAAVALVLLSATAAAREDPTASIELGMDAATPGEDASLIVMLSTTGAPKIAAIHFEVSMPSALVSFAKISERAGASASEAVVKTEIVKAADASQTTVRVDVSASKPIQDGMLVAVDVDVSKKAAPGTNINVTVRNATARSVGGRQIPTRVADGLIAVMSTLEPPVAACFFYMH